jgi:protein-S-isoprenylcysteine O-methyltransferase Ste14
MVALGRFLFRYRGVVAPLILLAVLIVCTPFHPQDDPDLDEWMDAAGALIVLLGLAVRAITIGYEYIVRGGRNKQVYADALVQGGVYAHTRNPMYLGNGLIIVGCGVIINAWEFYLVALPLTALLYAAIIAAEEAYLRDKFGPEYDAYCARVNRILPRLSGFRQSVEGMQFNWRRVLVKDYNTIFLSIAAVLVLSVWDDYRILGEKGLPSTEVVLLVAVPWALLHFLVWRLKKTRRLEGDRRDNPRTA